MPTSVHYQISTIIEMIVALKPSSVLDIGAGTGKYGLLMREYLELWGNNGHLDKLSWRCRIDAIEAFEPYISPVHEYVYDRIYVDDATTVIEEISHKYDLAILIDVLEHIDKDRGRHFIKALRDKADAVIVSLPERFVAQGALFNNPYEVHRAEWSRSDFSQLGPCSFHRLGDKLICLMGAGAVQTWSRYKRANFRKRLRRRWPFLIGFYRAFRVLWPDTSGIHYR